MNRASSGFTAVQVGAIRGKNDPKKTADKPATPAEDKPSKGAVNVRSGNARVGVQADAVVGNITISINRRGKTT
ncbi:hypothetical protein [Nonomuraea typhae]|uniref:hypothetical protein n=1 Tax=Nonomuraea typhae TaxID=2603600 RepID=UPI001FEA0DA9|nr:hypothetical protein [Nonomuraea typhae]